MVYKYQNERLFGLQIELNYIQKGWVEEIDFSKNEYERKMDYIELPFLTHVMLGKRALRYYVNLGTGFSYLLSEKESLNIVDEDLRREYYDTKIENEFDFSGIGDLGVVYHSKIGEFQVGFRYQYSFTDIFDKAEDRYYDQSQNSVISFSITYFIFSNQ